MESGAVELKPVDAVEVTIVMDTFVDILMAGADGVQRFKLAYDWSENANLLAEHGFSALLTLEVDGARQAVLLNRECLPPDPDGATPGLTVVCRRNDTHRTGPG